MTDARTEILRRVRAALADVPAGEEVHVPRDYERRSELDAQALVALLVERLEDYHARPRRVTLAALRAAVTQVCSDFSLRRLAVPPMVPMQWRPDGVEIVEDAGLTASELDDFDGALTGCAAAIAQTGTILLDGRGVSGRRPLTLVPDHHICVIETDQIVGIVPEAFARLAPAVADLRLPVTLVSGPSATSDIELTRVEGVHGPRNLHVLIVER